MPKSAAKAIKPKQPSKPAAKRAVRQAANGSDEYADIRRDLERQRADLLEEAGMALLNRSELEPFPDMTDQASAEVDQNFSLRLKEREQKLVKKIDEALERIASGTYGICERCGQTIPYKRLKARPVTTLCIECKTLQEQEEKVRQ
ncbi:MAG: TraR/DksA C4-type zinc finger protein [Nitrospirota bacterium]